MNLKEIKNRVTENEVVRLLKASIERWQSVNSSQLAAALAYHTIFSLAPLLIISIYVAGLILGRSDAQQYVVNQIQNLLGDQGTEVILSMIHNLQERSSGLIASILSLFTVIFGATRVFNQLETTLNILFGSADETGDGIKYELRKRGQSFALMLGVSILLLLSVLFSTGLSLVKNLFMDIIPQWETLIQILKYVIPVIMATILFSAIFKFLPEADLSWRNTLIGAALTAVLFSVGQILISNYLGNSSIASAYGAAGSLLVILVWIYYSAQIFYFGAAFTKEFAERNSPLLGN